MRSASPNDRRAWYNPERRLRRKPQCLLPTRRWIELNDSSSASSVSSDASQDRFVLLSYNVLGDDNASYHGDMYVNISSDVMRWESRKHLICQEICRWSADIVCLQEVDRYNDILTNVKKQGYAGNYKRRTGEAKDGCAVFWKEKRFRLLEADTIQFYAFGLRDNVAQLLVFELCEASSRRVIVGNIHVLFNPKRGDIKLGQVRILLSKAHALSEKWGGIPVVLAGDFNSTPQSAIYEFLSNSKLNITARDRRGLSGQVEFSQYGIPRFLNYCWSDEELKNATGNSNCTQLTHPLKLRSSYAAVKSNALTRGPCGEPLATTCHSKFIGTVDYLWYSTGLASTRVLDTLPIDTLKRLGGLPSEEIGSDHLALASEFVFTKCRELQAQDPTNITTTEEECQSLQC